MKPQATGWFVIFSILIVALGFILSSYVNIRHAVQTAVVRPLLTFEKFTAVQLDEGQERMRFSGEIGYYFPDHQEFHRVDLFREGGTTEGDWITAGRLSVAGGLYTFRDNIRYINNEGQELVTQSALYNRGQKELWIESPFVMTGNGWTVAGVSLKRQMNEKITRIEQVKMNIKVIQE